MNSNNPVFYVSNQSFIPGQYNTSSTTEEGTSTQGHNVSLLKFLSDDEKRIFLVAQHSLSQPAESFPSKANRLEIREKEIIDLKNIIFRQFDRIDKSIFVYEGLMNVLCLIKQVNQFTFSHFMQQNRLDYDLLKEEINSYRLYSQKTKEIFQTYETNALQNRDESLKTQEILNNLLIKREELQQKQIETIFSNEEFNDRLIKESSLVTQLIAQST